MTLGIPFFGILHASLASLLYLVGPRMAGDCLTVPTEATGPLAKGLNTEFTEVLRALRVKT